MDMFEVSMNHLLKAQDLSAHSAIWSAGKCENSLKTGALRMGFSRHYFNVAMNRHGYLSQSSSFACRVTWKNWYVT